MHFHRPKGPRIVLTLLLPKSPILQRNWVSFSYDKDTNRPHGDSLR